MNQTDQMEMKSWKCCVCGKISFSAICLIFEEIWFDYCDECYNLINYKEAKEG